MRGDGVGATGPVSGGGRGGSGGGGGGGSWGEGSGGCGLHVLGGALYVCAMCEGRGLRGVLMRVVCRNTRVRV